MSVRKIRNSWWVDFRFEGQRYRKKSPENTQAGARVYEATLRSRLARGESLVAPEKPTEVSFTKLSEEWMRYLGPTLKHSGRLTKEVILRKHLRPFFGLKPIQEIKTNNIEQYKHQKQQSGLANKTINDHLAVLNTCLNFAVDDQRLASKPRIRLLKVMPPRRKWLTEDEVQKLIKDESEPIWNLMIHLALKTGLRIGEMIGLEWHDIDFEKNILTVQRAVVKGVCDTPKSHRIRHIPLAPDIRMHLFEFRKTQGRVFSADDGSTVLTYRMTRRALGRISKRAGVRDLGWHALRHTFASQLAQRRVSLYEIQKLLGHSTIKMTEIYAHLMPTTLHQAVSLLEAPIIEEHGQPMGNTKALARRAQ